MRTQSTVRSERVKERRDCESDHRKASKEELIVRVSTENGSVRVESEHLDEVLEESILLDGVHLRILSILVHEVLPRLSSRGDSRECELEDSLSRLRLVDDCGEESEHGNSSREEFVFAPE